MHTYCKLNYANVLNAVSAIESGNLDGLADSMHFAQHSFDVYAFPLCPTQLCSPILHKLIFDITLKRMTKAIKGVGNCFVVFTYFFNMII